jgi:hypothetical protein
MDWGLSERDEWQFDYELLKKVVNPDKETSHDVLAETDKPIPSGGLPEFGNGKSHRNAGRYGAITNV